MSEELVKRFKLETKTRKSTWDKNNGEFKKGKTAVTKNLRFPHFTNKIEVDGSKFYVNKNVQQKYKIIFGLDFLIENKFDFIITSGVIDWQGIQIAIDGNEFSTQDKNECQNNGKQLNGNAYRKHIGSSVASHKDVEQLSANEKKALVSIMSKFEGLLMGIVGDYKEMEVSFDVDTNKTPYHAKSYRSLVAHTPLMKTAIKEMCKNKALAEYSGDSEWAAPTFGVPKKNDGVRVNTDFRRLNEAIKRNPWPMPTIQDMLHQ